MDRQERMSGTSSEDTSRRRGFVLGGLSCVVAGLSVAAAPRDAVDALPNLEQAVPPSFDGWRRSDDMTAVPAVTEGAVAEIYQEVLTRGYTKPGLPGVMLVIAYGGDQSDSMKAHRQETCYRAQGFRVEGLVSDVARLGESGAVSVSRFTARMASRREDVSYWMTMGSHVVQGRLDRLVAQLGDGVFGVRPDGFLVRVSTPSSDGRSAWALHDDFVSSLLAGLAVPLRRRLAGPLTAVGA